MYMPIANPTAATGPLTLRLSGDWLVAPVSLKQTGVPALLSPETARAVPECGHLQPVLYPDNPYWGESVRAINDQAWLYQRSFTVPADSPFRHVQLRFEAVDYWAEVWLNGQFIGTHEGNFAPFALDITEQVRWEHENILSVRVSSPWDNPNPKGSYPVDHVIRGLVKGLYEHGEGVLPPAVNPIGIWRPVWLTLDDGIRLEQAQIVGHIVGKVELRLVINNVTAEPRQGRLCLEINAANHAGPGLSAIQLLSVAPGQSMIETALQLSDPRLWWPWDHGDPNLYQLTAVFRDTDGTVSNTLGKQFGLREVVLERSAERFTYRINGRPVFIRGSAYIPAAYLSQCSMETLNRDLAFVRDLNLNLIRVHVHVAPVELYDLCDHAGILIWQDFELNWMHTPTLEFEQRARAIQQDMFDLLSHHPSIITWSGHNEPTMLYLRRENLEQHPDPALYRDACDRDSTRPIFLCSGQMEADWLRSGDTHSYYGTLWTADYTDVYRFASRLTTEFGCEAPASIAVLKQYLECWERLCHLEHQVDELGEYQAQVIRYHVEHYRRQRASGSAGYIHFWLADLVPQVGWGVLDANRNQKGGYQALKAASTPLQIALEYDADRAYQLWLFNDTMQRYQTAVAKCQVFDFNDQLRFSERYTIAIEANCSCPIASTTWPILPADCRRVVLTLYDADGELLAQNSYDKPFQPIHRPRGYPWKFDSFLGCKVFDRPDTPSLVDHNSLRLLKLIPLTWREITAEWGLRQQVPIWISSTIAKFTALWTA